LERGLIILDALWSFAVHT